MAQCGFKITNTLRFIFLVAVRVQFIMRVSGTTEFNSVVFFPLKHFFVVKPRILI